MSHSGGEVTTIALGIVLGMAFFRQTGFSPGGIITPGFLALEMASPERVLAAFAAGAAVALLLEGSVRLTGIYGRQKTALAMLFALGIMEFLDLILPAPSLWIGWVVPGLLGADMHRQGAVPTAAAALSTAFAASMAALLLGGGGM